MEFKNSNILLASSAAWTRAARAIAKIQLHTEHALPVKFFKFSAHLPRLPLSPNPEYD